MNEHPSDSGGQDLSAALRLQLRGLRGEVAPARDLWPGIAARLDEAPAAARPAPPVRRRWAPPALATAAVLALAVGAAWQMRPDAVVPAPQAVAAAASAPLVLEAQAMTREYEGALRELPPVPAAAEYGLALDQLDASAGAVRAALAQTPDAHFLLEHLQRIYSRRLSLTRQLVRS